MRPLVAERRYAAPGTAPSTGQAYQAQPQQPSAPAQPQVRRDPAPTRMAYRMQRLWLTPLFRVLVRVGIPGFVIALVTLLWLGNDERRAAMLARVDEMREAVENRPEFRVNVLEITGASPSLDAAIRDMLALKLPVSSFDLDLEAARAKIATLDAVENVLVKVGGSGALEVTITERIPALILRRGEELDLLDGKGRRVARILSRADRPDLPLVAGEGASLAADEALMLVAAAGPILPRLRGLVRISERRWDLVLDRGQRILLPAQDPVRALERLLALDKAEDLMNRDVLTMDLRNQQRPTLRLAPAALREMRRSMGLVTVENDL
ncbi:cell division protein FtsQ/DivIB [Gemmobacter serpentinus]|uniref:cell division protein FtsQ/DivIB n=1 Tax=Gemmobacter serpentinus TaxID=2652247 RepID=UPI00124D8C6A|nr:cell division protein FtsQ/DivIB [Gemmobacter serpentinus]